MAPCTAKNAMLSSMNDTFKMEFVCDEDGYYFHTQCWKQGSAPEQEVCWCSLLDGKMIVGTFYLKINEGAKPDCARHVGKSKK